MVQIAEHRLRHPSYGALVAILPQLLRAVDDADDLGSARLAIVVGLVANGVQQAQELVLRHTRETSSYGFDISKSPPS